jgi:hypothetical protein
MGIEFAEVLVLYWKRGLLIEALIIPNCSMIQDPHS